MKTKKASAVTPAENELQDTSYQGMPIMSNLKDSIGEILLYLQFPLEQKQQQKGYNLLKILLMQYVETKFQGDKL